MTLKTQIVTVLVNPTFICRRSRGLESGDLLAGDGYRLISTTGFGEELKDKMIRMIFATHRELCLGQGIKPRWRARGGQPKVKKVP